MPIFTNTQIIIFWIIIGIIFFSFTYFVIKKYFLNKKKIDSLNSKPQEIDYKSQALEKIKKAREQIKLNNLKKFHLEVTDIIKEYSAKKHQVNFPKMTTKEITSQLDLIPIKKDKFKDFLKQCDLVKFANKESKKDLAQDIYKTGVDIIHKI